MVLRIQSAGGMRRTRFHMTPNEFLLPQKGTMTIRDNYFIRTYGLYSPRLGIFVMSRMFFRFQAYPFLHGFD